MSKMFVTAPELIVHRLIIFILKVKALKIFFRIHLIFLCYREEYFTHLQEISINRDADVENGLWMQGERERVRDGGLVSSYWAHWEPVWCLRWPRGVGVGRGRGLYSLLQGKESDLDGHILAHGACSRTPNESGYWTRYNGDVCFWGGGHWAKGSISRVLV